MKVTDLKKKIEVISCPTEKEAIEICKLMHESGLKFINSLIHNNWHIYKEFTCYYPKESNPILWYYGNINFIKEKNYKIYLAKLFIRESKINKILK